MATLLRQRPVGQGRGRRPGEGRAAALRQQQGGGGCTAHAAPAAAGCGSLRRPQPASQPALLACGCSTTLCPPARWAHWRGGPRWTARRCPARSRCWCRAWGPKGPCRGGQARAGRREGRQAAGGRSACAAQRCRRCSPAAAVQQRTGRREAKQPNKQASKQSSKQSRLLLQARLCRSRFPSVMTLSITTLNLPPEPAVRGAQPSRC